MTVRIKLKTTIVVPGLEGDEVALPGDVKTVRDLLLLIGGKIRYDLIDPSSGRLGDDLEIIVNDKEIWFYSGGLDAPLKGGDSVEIHMVPLGGG